MKNVLIVGATRGLGAELVEEYSKQPDTAVYGTSRSSVAGKHGGANVHWIGSIDIGTEDAGKQLASQHSSDAPFDVAVITAGYFALESFDEPDWAAEVKMYTTSAVGPVFLTRHLVKAGLLRHGSKLVLVTSESGSIALRHEKEGGGNYGHHASKAAENMVGKLLSLDLKDHGVAVANVHPGFMRTEMTAGVGFDKYWDDGGGRLRASFPNEEITLTRFAAVTPAVAAQSLVEWIETFDISKTGEFWAPRGAADIGTADVVLGPKDQLPLPLRLPW